MTTPELGVALAQVTRTEALARAAWETACRDLTDAERDDAMTVLRQAIALKRVLERWLTARAIRAVTAVIALVDVGVAT